jgi:alkylated DNA repair protein alkB family protein 6
MAAGVCDESTAPNHVLVNEYDRPVGITPHNDGALYAPHVAIITLSGSAGAYTHPLHRSP